MRTSVRFAIIIVFSVALCECNVADAQQTKDLTVLDPEPNTLQNTRTPIAPVYSINHAMDPEVRFTYPLPAGWREMKVPGIRYKGSHASGAYAFTPNIVWHDGTHDCGSSLKECANLETGMVQIALQHNSNFEHDIDWELITDSPFTANGEDGWKVVFEWTGEGIRVRQASYYFGETHKFLLATYSRDAGPEQPDLDAQVQHSILSIRLLD